MATYLEETPADRRECLNAIRDICREVLGDYNEGMDYGMPSYRRDGEVEVAFASQKKYISLHNPRPVAPNTMLFEPPLAPGSKVFAGEILLAEILEYDPSF